MSESDEERFKHDPGVWREQSAVVCTCCGHPVTLFEDGELLYVGCLNRNQSVNRDEHMKEGTVEDLFDEWISVPVGTWSRLSEDLAEVTREHVGRYLDKHDDQ